MKKYSVIYTPDSGYTETFGPFDTKAKANDWMADDFNHNYKVAKDADVDVQWTWNENHSCSIEGLGSWEIVENY